MNKIIIPSAVLALLIGGSYFGFSSSKEQPTAQQLTKTQQRSYQTELESLFQIHSLQERSTALHAYFTNYLPNDIETALAEINALDSRQARTEGYTALFVVWHQDDALALHYWLSNTERNTSINHALINLIEHVDITDKFNYANLIHASTLKQSQIESLISAYIVSDTETVLHWLALSGPENDAQITLAFEKLTSNSMTDAVYALSSLENASYSQQQFAIEAIVNNYQEGDADSETLAAIESVAPYEVKVALISALLPMLAQEANIEFEDLYALLDNVLEGDVKDALNAQLAHSWTARNPTEAANFAESLQGEAKEHAVNAVITNWVHTDLQAANDWLKTVDGNIDLAASTIGKSSAELGNLQIANDWVNVIEDGDLRKDSITEVLQGMYRRSPESGIYHLVFQKSLSTEEKLEMLHEIYPNEVFLSPKQALHNIRRLEGIEGGFGG